MTQGWAGLAIEILQPDLLTLGLFIPTEAAIWPICAVYAISSYIAQFVATYLHWFYVLNDSSLAYTLFDDLLHWWLYCLL